MNRMALIHDRAVGADMDMLERLVEAVMFLLIEVFVILVCQLVLVLAPDRHHAVDRLLFLILLEFVLAAFLRLLPVTSILIG